MARVKRGFKARRRRNKVLKLTKGYFGRRSNCYTIATEAHDRAMKYAYRDRKVNKREFRSIWIARLNSAIKTADVNYSYSRFIHDLKSSNVQLDRKILAYLAAEEPKVFQQVLSFVRA